MKSPCSFRRTVLLRTKALSSVANENDPERSGGPGSPPGCTIDGQRKDVTVKCVRTGFTGSQLCATISEARQQPQRECARKIRHVVWHDKRRGLSNTNQRLSLISIASLAWARMILSMHSYGMISIASLAGARMVLSMHSLGAYHGNADAPCGERA